MEVKQIRLEHLKEYENNPRQNDEAVDKVAESIKKFGFKIPIIVDSNLEIIAGHTRKKASLKLGLEEVPVIIADDLNDEQIKAFRLADNKVAEFSEWDMELLMSELEEIEMNMENFGFDELEKIEIEPDEEDTSSVDLVENVVIVIEEDTEEKLEKTFAKLIEEGYQCRLLTL